VLELIADVPAVFGKDRTIGCLLSLGTGVPPDLKLGTGLSSVPQFINIASNSERAHYQVSSFASILPQPGDDKYWRFNLSKQLSNKDWVITIASGKGGATKEKRLVYEEIMVKMDDWQSIGLIQQLTDKWLDLESVDKDLANCARKLNPKDDKVPVY